MRTSSGSRPFISFVIPAHNMSGSVGRCLESILGQSFASVEAIVIDDASDDGTLDEVRRHAEKDARVRYLSYPDNRSAHCARYDGVNEARGEYIWFVDADDEISPDSCAELHEMLSKKPVDIVHFGTEIVNDGNLPESRVDNMRRFVKPYDGTLSGRDVFEKCFVDNAYRFNIWNKVFDATLCRKAFGAMSYVRLPKAQDEYEYYVLSFYARSYRGVPDSKHYVYHFGGGITGHNLLDEKQFERYCTMALSFSEISKFSERVTIDDKYSQTLAKIETQLFDDCFANWNNNVPPKLKGAGLDSMMEYWGDTKVISAIAQKNWYNQGAIANDILTSKRLIVPGRQVRTVATFYHTFKNGGVQRVVSGLMKIWLSLGYKVILITDEAPTDEDYYMPPGVIREVIPSVADTTRDTYLDRSVAMSEALRKHSVDVLVYHAWVTNILLWDLMTCKACGVSFVAHCHNIFSMLARNSRAYFAALPSIYRHCDAVVTLSDVDREFWSNFNSNAYEVFNPFTFDLDTVPQSKLDSKTVLWIGRMSDEKRPKDALKIFKEVLEEVPDAKLMMVGGGNQKLMNNLYKMIDELGIRDSVIMQGFMLDVMPVYQLSSVLLCTSEYEGFLLTLAEAQSAGVPCVMYELPYLTLTRRNMGLVQVPQMNTSMAAKEVVRMLNSEAYRKEMGAQARACIESYRDYDFEGTWKSIFDSLSEEHVPMSEDDKTKIMWDTLMSHYRTGAARNNAKIDELSKKTAGKEVYVTNNDIVEQYEQEIRNIKDSMTYRIGELITYIPKYLRGDFKK